METGRVYDDSRISNVSLKYETIPACASELNRKQSAYYNPHFPLQPFMLPPRNLSPSLSLSLSLSLCIILSLKFIRIHFSSASPSAE
ncbi:hypothetical protein CDL12_10328 [Handroanthus impetiginosus]|uniref:Uncharacterized protein n=1 Tax=Handroanthus impetiginosus TaxID=429701 RepID=A0A2G9HHW9_9LAMI|nr:hypothetical protein CDL12_10328 [Handroanthus impetiginosus]